MPAPEPTIVLPADSASVLESAELYVRLGLSPVPVHGITRTGDCTCGGGCAKPGKHPVGNGWQRRASLDLDVVRDVFRDHAGNIGLYLGGTNYVVIDADGDEGLATLDSWELPRTLRAQSGSGKGAHLLFELAAHHDKTDVTDRRVAPGIDVKTRGQFVVAPSRHASGGVYQWVDPSPIAILPDDTYARIRRPRATPPAPSSTPAPSGDAGDIYERARKYADACEPAIAGAGGHNKTFDVARALFAWSLKGLPESTAWALFVDYNARCEPPWSERELQHKWESAKRANKLPELADRPRAHLRAIAGGRAAALAPAVSAAEDNSGSLPPEPPAPPPGGGGGLDPDWRGELLWTSSKNGNDKLVSHYENVVRILQLAPEWRGRIRYDSFASRVVVNDLPWDEYQRPNEHAGTWTDEDGSRLSGWLRRKFHRFAFCPAVTDCDRAVDVVAQSRAFHPVRDYLDALEWDGVSRLTRWLATYLGAEPNDYHAMVGRWWLVGACARVYQPGCMVRTVPILEGPQELGKSSAVRILASPAWFNDTPIDLGSKDAYQAIQGYWFNELAELDSLMRADPSRSKAFFSSAIDKFRPPYGRRIVESPRQCVFVGTVNPPYEYLNDPSGGTRYHPIRCTRIDLEALERDRDQLWAEAVHEYRDGAEWYVEGAVDRALLGEQQDLRTKSDAWESRIDSYLTKLLSGSVTTSELLENALKLDPKDWTQATQTRVGILMVTRFHWSKRRIRVGTRQTWVYERDDRSGASA